MAARGGRGSGLITVEGQDGRGGEKKLDKFGFRNLNYTIEILVARMSKYIWKRSPNPKRIPSPPDCEGQRAYIYKFYINERLLSI